MRINEREYFSVAELDELIDRQLTLLKTRYVNDAGIISYDYPPTDRTLISEFDDLVPFLIELGEGEWLAQQIDRIVAASEREIALFRGLPVFGRRYVVAWRTDEWIGGLFAIQKSQPRPAVERWLREGIEFILGDMSAPGYFAAFYDVRRRAAHKFFSHKSMAVGEVMLENPDSIAEWGLTDRLEEWLGTNLQKALNDPYFRKFGMCPALTKGGFYTGDILAARALLSDFCQEGDQSKSLWTDVKFMLRSFQYTHVMKDGTNFIFFLLELCRRRPGCGLSEHIDRWIENLVVNEHGVVATHLKGKKLTRRTAFAPSQNFPVIDIICDYCRYVERRESHVEVATAIADGLLRTRWSNGLLPRSSLDHCFLDEQVDFAISLMRLSLLTNERGYLLDSLSLAKAIFTHHSSDEGLYSYLHQDGRRWTISPKYNALALKLLIVVKALHQSDFDAEKVLNDPRMLDLMKDR